jgi:VanZ family protein
MKSKPISIAIWSLFIISILLLALLDLDKITNFDFSNGFIFRHVLTFSFFLPFTKLVFKQLNLFQVCLAAIAFGFGIEIAQALFTNGARSFSWMDLLYDMLGILIGIVITLILPKKITIKK